MAQKRVIPELVEIDVEEARSFEPFLNNIAEWIIDNPKPNWLSALIETNGIGYQQRYGY